MTILDDRAAKAIQEAMDARVRALSANHPTTHMAEVIEIDQAGVTWVHIFGGADRTPAIRSLAQVKKGDLVTVTIEDGVVTINGSSSNPAASVEYVEAADYAIAEYAKQAMAAVLGDVLQVKEAIIERATIEDLTAVEATVQTLTASYANLNEIVAGKATIVDLNAATARISQLEADDVTINGKITAAEGRIGTIESDYLKTTDMDAEVARVGTLLTGYAEADLANVNNAWIQNGVIKDAAITNEMVGSLSANKLTAGTINGANINVTNLNADNITTGTINGQRIGQGSLSLDKLAEDVYTESEVDAIVDGLNDRIDGAIETHTGTVVPTLNNSPASSWNTTDLKDEHIGDVYYVVNSQSQQNGYCYRFTKTGNTYSWQLIKDSDVTAALSRLETAEGKITTFDSDISTLKTDTGVLKTKTQTLETSLGDKVDTSTFNELSSTVDENSSTITSMSTVLTNNGLTSSTNITNTVNTVSQTASSNSSVISQLASTLGTNADGTTKAGDIVHRTSAVEQDLSTFKTTVSSTYATQTSVENAQADATKALNRQTAYFATSSTGATTTAKTASSSNFPTLVAGVTVTVRFSTANTSTSAITLNVNSTGAKTIYVNGATTASGNQLLWSANANITFTYDGTYWRVVSEPRTWYGTCSTAAGTAAKTSTINEIVVCKGTVVKLNMTYANTNTSATMNITSTGAKNLYYGTSTTRPTTANGYGWGASSTATFVFDGQYWRVGDTSVVARLIQAESTISSHTTSIEQNATNIALKANSSEVYTKTQTDGLISTEVTNRNAAITAASNSITASVEETYATKTALADGLEDANDYTDSEISSAKAEIKVTTDGISSEVSNKVGSSEIISKINQSAETVKIQASKVEIDGTAIFNSISSNVDSAITSKGYQTSSQVESAISAAVDNIEVGGRNLVGFSADYRNWSKSANVTFDNDVVDINVSGQTSNQFKRAHGYLTESNLVDGTYTLSFEVYCDDWSAVTSDKAAGYTSACLQMCYYDCDKWSSPTNVKRYRYNSLGLAENWSVQPTQENGKWLKFVSVPITLPDSFTNDVNKGTAREIVVEPMLRRNGHVRFRKIKFERSNVATDWTPAPEDMATTSEVGAIEPPYTEVEWVESNGQQFVYLDWKPSAATWGFEADFIINNAFSTTVGAFAPATNADGYGNVFGTRNASTVNDFQLGTYGTNGLIRYGGGKEYSTAGILKTDKTRQTVKLLGTTLTRGDGTAVTITRGTDTANKPYQNMVVFCMYNSTKRCSGTGNVAQPGSVRIYSLKFYESTTLKVDLVGAIRKSDKIPGLYDKVSQHFYPAVGLTYGNDVGDLGAAKTISEQMVSSCPSLAADNTAATRLWRASAPTIEKLDDNQEIIVTPRYNVGNSTQTTELADWDDTSSNSNVYLKLTLADNTTTEWVPCYYTQTSRLTSHYGSGMPVRMVYKENCAVNASSTSFSSIMRGWFCDPIYNTNNYDRVLHNNYILAAAAVSSGKLACGTASGYIAIAASATFDLSYPILWAGGAWSANTKYANAYEVYPGVNPATTGTVEGIAIKKQVYLKGTVSGNTFTCASSNFLTCNVPTSEQSAVDASGNRWLYIPLGVVAQDATTKMFFTSSKDLYAYIDGKFRQVTPTEILASQYVYIQAASGTMSVDAPDSWVEELGESVATEGSDSQSGDQGQFEPVWTTKRPTYNSDYPLVYVATQHKRLDGTVSCTIPLRDDSTTIIDGGHITTGVIDASKVSVTNLNASNITSGTIDAKLIDAEKLSIKFTNVDGLSEELNGKASTLDVQDVQGELSKSIGALESKTDNAIGELSQSTSLLDERVGYFEGHFYTTTVGEGAASQPAFVISADGNIESSGLKTVLTNSSLMFQDGGQTVAQVTNQELDITRTKVTESMQLGNFMWIPLSDGSLAFKWIES